ncbi:MAG: hypothetical protein ABIP30_02185 [Ferruginibacter sp.]
MKKILAVLGLSLIFMNTNAQLVKTVPHDLKQKRLITGKLNVEKGYEHATLSCEIVTTEGKGETLKFNSSVNIARVEVAFTGVANSTQVSTYQANTKDGYFYLESGAYKNGLKSGYTLNFYVLRNERPIWTFTVGPKK